MGGRRVPVAGQRITWAILSVIVLMSSAGCGGEVSLGSAAPERGWVRNGEARFEGRPGYAEQSEQYALLLTEARDALDEMVPPLDWGVDKVGERLSVRCSVDANARQGVFDLGDAVGAIPPDDWDAVRERLVGIAARHGFTDGSDFPENNSLETIVIADGMEARFEVYSGANTTLTVYGACLRPRGGSSGGK